MPEHRRLSARERTLLAEISRTLHDEDPRWAAQFSIPTLFLDPPPAERRRVRRPVAAIIVGVLGVIGLVAATDVSSADRLPGLALLAATAAVAVAIATGVAVARSLSELRAGTLFRWSRGRQLGRHRSPV